MDENEMTDKRRRKIIEDAVGLRISERADEVTTTSEVESPGPHITYHVQRKRDHESEPNH